jgi:ferrous iron transport protein A
MKFKLSELEQGVKKTIDSITDHAISGKLMEMGCVPGEQIEICHKAPFGDPIAIHVSGYKLSLRLKEAENILVK